MFRRKAFLHWYTGEGAAEPCRTPLFSYGCFIKCSLPRLLRVGSGSPQYRQVSEKLQLYVAFGRSTTKSMGGVARNAESCNFTLRFDHAENSFAR